MSFKKNIGGVDKWARIIIGIIIVGVGYYMPNWIVGIIGAIIFITGITDWCLLYEIFGISTCKIEQTEEEPSNAKETNQ